MTGKTKILIVDDYVLNVEIIIDILEDDYELLSANSGLEAIEKIISFEPDIILLDIMMPDMDGFEVIQALKNRQINIENIKIVLISALITLDTRLKGYEAGAIDFIIKPFEIEELKAKVAIFAELKKAREVEQAFNYTIGALARAAEASDEDTGNHIIRVNEYSYSLAKRLGLNDDFCNDIRQYAQMHDVGKIHVSPEILKKKGRLTNEEFAKMKMHPHFGAKIIGDSQQLKMAREIALTHHEKWNGEGYPYGLKGKDIPITGRIVAIADVYDSLRSHRSYKPSFDHEKTMKILTEGDDRITPSEHFDPEILKLFLEHHVEFDNIFKDLQD